MTAHGAGLLDDPVNWRQVLFVVSNLFIMAGYVFVAFRVLPLFPIRLVSKAGSVSFFLLCASTHGDQLYHTLTDQTETWGEISGSVHMLVIHVPQAIAVWVFAVGFFRDLRRLAEERQTTAPADG